MYLLAGLRPSSQRSFFDTGIFDTDVFAEYRLEVEGAGHWLQFERPAEVAGLLLDWIGRH